MCFGLNFFEIFKDTFFQEHLRTTASEIHRVSFLVNAFLFLWTNLFCRTQFQNFTIICLKEQRFYFATICVESLCWILSVSLWCNCLHKSIPYVFFSHRLVYYDKKRFVQSWWIWQPFTLQVTNLLHQKSLNYQNLKVRAEEVLRKHFPKMQKQPFADVLSVVLEFRNTVKTLNSGHPK